MSEEVDYQIASEVDDEQISVGDECDEEFIDFRMEANAVFKRLAEDIYEGPIAGIREPVSNAAAAIKRAEDEYGLENGVIEITLERKYDGLKLKIRDNGIGITDTVLREVLSVIGRSMNRDEEDLGGKFGMGFLSIWMICGLDSGFEMHTHSRKEGEEPISGVWKNGGFSKLSTERLKNSMDEEEYGTLFEIEVKPTISRHEIRNWVEEVCEYSRVKVIYKEFNEDGNELFNEEYGDKNIDSEYEDKPSVTYEDKWVKIVSSDDARKNVFVLDVPVKMGGSVDGPFNNNDIRFKSENSVVVDGPNKGLQVVKRSEYKDKNNKDDFISEGMLKCDDVVLPSPTGTRDRLEKRKDFNRWVSEKLEDEFKKKINKIVASLSDAEDIFNLSLDEKGCLCRFYNDYYRHGPVQSLSDCIDVNVPSGVEDILKVYSGRVMYIPSDSDPKTKTGNKVNYTYILDHKRRVNNGDVFMGVSINETKADIVWEDSESNVVVTLDESGTYEQYERIGWKKLKNINSSNIDNFDVSDELSEKITGSKTESVDTRNNPGDKKLTVHFDGTRKSNKKIKASKIKNYANCDELDTVAFKNNRKMVILFPSNSERKISEYKWLTGNEASIAKCPVSVYEYLKDCDGVFSIEEALERADNHKVETSLGEMKLKNISQDAFFHIVDDEMYELMNPKIAKKKAAEYMSDEVFTGGFRKKDIQSNVYVPIKIEDYRIMYPKMRNRNIITGEIDYTPNQGDVTVLKNETRMYSYIRLRKWEGTSVFNRMKKINVNMKNGGFELVETFARMHDAGERPVDTTLNEFDDLSNFCE